MNSCFMSFKKQLKEIQKDITRCFLMREKLKEIRVFWIINKEFIILYTLGFISMILFGGYI